MEDAIPRETWDRVDEIVDDYTVWYDALDPVTKAIVDNSAFPAFIEALDARDGSTLIGYGMENDTFTIESVSLPGVQYRCSNILSMLVTVKYKLNMIPLSCLALVNPDEKHQYRNKGDVPFRMICGVPSEFEQTKVKGDRSIAI